MTGPRVAFVNGGILGLTAFATYLRRFLPTQSWIRTSASPAAYLERLTRIIADALKSVTIH